MRLTFSKSRLNLSAFARFHDLLLSLTPLIGLLSKMDYGEKLKTSLAEIRLFALSRQ